MLDPLPEVQGVAYPQILGIPSMIDPASGVASGRSIDGTGNPGLLHGSILVRNVNDGLRAAYNKVAQDIGAAREEIDWYAPTNVPFECKQFSGYSKQGIEKISHGLVMSEEGERLMIQQASSAVHILFERYLAGFFTNRGAEVYGGKTATSWGGDIDWQAGATGGTDLDSSKDAMDVLSSIISAARLRAGGAPINACYMSRGLAERFCREASVLGRVITGSAGDPATSTLTGFQGQRVMPASYLAGVFREHLGIDELVISDCIHDNGAVAGTPSYVWPSDRLWLGSAGTTALSVAGGSPRVLQSSGAFCGVIGKIQTAVGPEQKNAPQFMEAIAEMWADVVPVNAAAGTLVYNLG